MAYTLFREVSLGKLLVTIPYLPFVFDEIVPKVKAELCLKLPFRGLRTMKFLQCWIYFIIPCVDLFVLLSVNRDLLFFKKHLHHFQNFCVQFHNYCKGSRVFPFGEFQPLYLTSGTSRNCSRSSPPR